MRYTIPGVFCSMKQVGDDRFNLSWFTKDQKKWAMMLSTVKALPVRYFSQEDKCWWTDAKTARMLGECGWKISGNTNSKPNKETGSKPARNPLESIVPPTYREYALAPEIIPTYVPEERQKELIDSVELDPSRDLIPGLRDYQVDFIKFAGIKNGRVALLDDMGTGKTLQSLAWLAYARAFPALIVVNAPTKLQWKAEYKRWLKLVPGCPTRVNVLKGKRPYYFEPGVTCIINWDIIHDWKDVLKKAGFQCIIGDEVQAIGNPDSKRAKAFLQLADKIPQCIMMSGTPARSKTCQYWTMLHCINPQQFPKYGPYRYRYCGPKVDGYCGVTFDGTSNGKELHALMVENSIRRTKDQVMKFLPSKTISVIPMDVDNSAMKEYESEESSIEFGENEMEQKNALSRLSRSAYVAKKESCVNWIKNFLETSDEKLLIFAWHISVVDDIYESLKEYNPAKIYGGTSLNERETEKRRFIEDSTCRVIVGNIQSLGTGIDGLQKACCHVAFVEFAYTSTDMDQATDRLHRGGQDRPVTVYYLVADGTVDNKIVEALDERRTQITAVMDGKEVSSDNLIADILKRLKG